MQSDIANNPLMEAYRLACTPMSFMAPQYQHISAWHEHLPLAFWLIESLQPRTVVELGTHYGVSYFAFCQAVKELGFETRCFAVDSWEGDAHAGKYDESVHSAVVAHNDEHYSAFSRLVRSSFENARQHFRDGEIDLLHIDGHHSYESVKRDFEGWLPKLSDRSIVILHDTNVRERGFGVFRLLEELRPQYRHFEFVHGHGLAVIGTGKQLGSQLDALFAMQSLPASRFALMGIFSRLGRTCADAVKLKQQGSEIVAVKQEVARAQDQCEALIAQAKIDAAKIGELQGELDVAEAARSRLQEDIESLGAEVADHQSAHDNLVREYEAQLSIRFGEIATLTKMVRKLENLQSKTLALRGAAIQEVRNAISALAVTGPQKSVLGRRRLLRDARTLEQAGLIDPNWYAGKYEDVARAGVNPSRHYLEYGLAEGRYPNPRLEK